MLKRIALGGASGYLGSFLKQELITNGITVLPISRHLLSTQSFQVWLMTEQPDVLLFANGIPNRGDTRAWSDLTEWMARWIRAAAGTSVRLVAWLGSAAQYGITASPDPREEASPAPSDLGAYGKNKAHQSEILRTTAEAVGIDSLECRVFNIIGPGLPDTLLVGKMLRTVRREIPESFEHSLDSVRDYLDPREIARLVSAVLEHKTAVPTEVPSIVNVGSGRGASGKEMWNALVEISAFDPKVTPPSGSPDFSIASVTHLAKLGLTPQFDLKDALRFALEGGIPR